MSLQTNIAAGFARLVQAVNALQTALGAKAPLNSPALTGTPTAPTAASSVATGQIATAGYVKSLFGAASTSGVLDWNDVSNTAPGGGPTLLLGDATNGPTTAGGYFHPFNFEYNSKNGTGNVTQMAIAYGNVGDEIHMRGRYNSVWGSWSRILTSRNVVSYAPGLTGAGATGTWPISITGGAATLQTARTLTVGNTGKAFNGSANVAWTVDEIGAEPVPVLGVPRSNLGNPTVREMALFDGQFDNKTERFNIANLFFETSTDNITWTDFAVSDDQKRKLVGGDSVYAGLVIPKGTAFFRIRLRAINYVFLNALYAYNSTQGHTTQVRVFKKHNSGDWTPHTSSTVGFSSWPGHLYLPFATIAWQQNGTLGTHWDEVYVLFQPSWTSYNSPGIVIDKLQLWGGYPAGRRNLYGTNEFGDAAFPAKLSAAGQISAPEFVGALTGNATGLLLGGSKGTAGQVPVSQGPALPPVWATPTAAGVNVQVFTTPGSSTWVKPAGAKLVEVIMIGGGGGGGSGRKGPAGTLVCGGGGGASGARAEFSISPTALGSTANVMVGAGGSGGASVSANSSNGLNGSFGGSSFFNFQLTASGVNPGQGGTSFSGTGGTNTNGNGFPNAPGFSGASGGSVTTSTAAGGSGGVNGVSATGGGAGGGILATGVLGASGAGGRILLSGNSGFVDIAPGAAGATGANGANGGDGKSDGAALWSGGTGGGGGGASTTGNAGAGGAGGNYGAGGGGGGAALDGVGNSGAGGRGGDGIVVVITYL